MSYGLKPLVKFGGTDSLFALWTKSNKDDLKAKNDEALLAEYIKFGIEEIRNLLRGVKANASRLSGSLTRRSKIVFFLLQRLMVLSFVCAN